MTCSKNVNYWLRKYDLFARFVSKEVNYLLRFFPFENMTSSKKVDCLIRKHVCSFENMIFPQ